MLTMPPSPPTRPTNRSGENQKLTALEKTAVAVNERLGELEECNDKIEKALWGTNGNVGIIGRLKLTEEIIADIKKLLWAILGVVLGIAVGGIWQAIVHANMP